MSNAIQHSPIFAMANFVTGVIFTGNVLMITGGDELIKFELSPKLLYANAIGVMSFGVGVMGNSQINMLSDGISGVLFTCTTAMVYLQKDNYVNLPVELLNGAKTLMTHEVFDKKLLAIEVVGVAVLGVMVGLPIAIYTAAYQMFSIDVVSEAYNLVSKSNEIITEKVAIYITGEIYRNNEEKNEIVTDFNELNINQGMEHNLESNDILVVED